MAGRKFESGERHSGGRRSVKMSRARRLARSGQERELETLMLERLGANRVGEVVLQEE